MRTCRCGRSRVLLTLALAAATVAGCEQAEVGTAYPETENSHSAQLSEQISSSSAPPISVDPCSLLAESQIDQYGEFSGPEKRSYQGYSVCSWAVQKDSASDVEAPLVDLVFRHDLGLEEVIDLGDGLQAGQTDDSGRELIKTSGIEPVTNTRSCLIAMKISDDSRLDVTVGRTEDSCELAGKVVEMVDSKLPRS